MKSNVILIFYCSFALFLASAAQASEFTDNTCYEESANCQTQSDWLTGWCEAAVAARAVDQTVAECAQAVGANRPDTQGAAAQTSEFTDNTCYEEGANCQTQSDWLTGWCEAAVAARAVDQTVAECAQAVGATTPAQNQNSNSSASSSRQSSGGGQDSQVRTSDNSGDDSGAQGLQGHVGNSPHGERASLPDHGSDHSNPHGERCQSYRVMRTDPSRLVCERPSPVSGSDSEGTPFNPFDTTPRPWSPGD